MTRPFTFIAGATLGTVIAAVITQRALQQSIRDGTLLRALTAQAEQLRAARAAANAPDEIEVDT